VSFIGPNLHVGTPRIKSPLGRDDCATNCLTHDTVLDVSGERFMSSAPSFVLDVARILQARSSFVEHFKHALLFLNFAAIEESVPFAP
jgi:hypothetical protein